MSALVETAENEPNVTSSHKCKFGIPENNDNLANTSYVYLRFSEFHLHVQLPITGQSRIIF